MNQTETKKKNKRKCNYQGTNKTLDICHENKLQAFQSEYQTLDKLKRELNAIQKKLNSANLDVNKRFELVDKEKEISAKIAKLESKEDEIDYLLNTSEILFDYYDTAHSDTPKSSRKIIDFFNQNKTEVDPNVASASSSSSNANERSDLAERYLAITDKDYINNNLIMEVEDICSYCKSRNVNILMYDGMQACEDCHTCELKLFDNDKPSYKEPPKEISYFSYNRINHLNECINQMQGKETTEIPQEVFDKILLELKKNRITNLAVLDFKTMKKILKRINANYYEHIPYIIHRLTGKSNPQLSPELEERLRNMFREIQGPFLKHAPAGRKNFLNYSYVLHKLLELLGE